MHGVDVRPQRLHQHHSAGLQPGVRPQELEERRADGLLLRAHLRRLRRRTALRQVRPQGDARPHRHRPGDGRPHSGGNAQRRGVRSRQIRPGRQFNSSKSLGQTFRRFLGDFLGHFVAPF